MSDESGDADQVTPQQRAVIAQFQERQSELEQLEREMTARSVALDEHRRVLKQMQPLESERRAMQNVAGVLVPRTVAEARAELEARVATFTQMLADLRQQHTAKADALRTFMSEHNLRITVDQTALLNSPTPSTAAAVQ